jgi:hypothetical protein
VPAAVALLATGSLARRLAWAPDAPEERVTPAVAASEGPVEAALAAGPGAAEQPEARMLNARANGRLVQRMRALF